MDNAMLMSMGKRVEDVNTQPESLIDWNSTVSKPTTERYSIDILHYQEIGSALLNNIEQRANVRLMHR